MKKMICQDINNSLSVERLPVGSSVNTSLEGCFDVGQPAVGVSGLLSFAPKFSGTENPYLFPGTLLDAWADTSANAWKCGVTAVIDFGAAAAGSGLSELASVSQPAWRLVHTKPRQEKKLAEALRRLQVPHFLPVTKCKAVTRGRTRMTQQPQFPGYLFLWADHEQRRTSLEINRIVAAYPVGCHENLGRHLWNLADLIEKGVPLRVEDRLAVGQTVRVKAGLLEGKRGVVIKRGGKTRLFVFVSEMLGGVSLEIEQHFLEPY